MKLWKMGWMLVVAGVVLAGCPTSDIDEDGCTRDSDCGAGQRCEQATGECVAAPTPTEDRNLLCTTSSDCLASELCHPTAKVCVSTCRASADCPDATKVCDVVSATDSRKVCQCSTDTLCNQGRQSADLVCSGLDKVCTYRCVADADCGSDRTCDTATGQCAAPVEPRNLACTDSSDCLASELCHPTAKVCVRTCASGTDCPDSAKTCEAMSATDSRMVCKCSTGALCNADRDTADLVCSDLDRVCTPKCASDVECGAGRTCDAATGQCEKAETLSQRCQADMDCSESEVCHPTVKVCVRTCASSMDCPTSAKNCEALSATYPQKVCKCSTDTLCNVERDTADLVCAIRDNVCKPKCASDAECATGSTCDMGTGHCMASGGTGSLCTGEGQSSCDYGTHFCGNGECTPLPTPTCVNYTNFQNKGSLGTTATILYGARMVSATTDTNVCGTATPKRVRISLFAYSSIPFPSTRDQVSGFFFVRVDGSPVPGNSLLFSGNDYAVSGTNRERAEFIVNLCVPQSSTNASTGFYFTNGNFLCFQANY